MKNKMFILMLNALLISLLSSNVFSEDTDPRIGLYYRLSPKDDTVSIDVFIQSASNVAGCQVWLTYNPAVLDYVDEVFEEGDYFPANAFYGQRQLESLSDTETRLRFAVASSPMKNKNSGIIATLTFKVLNAEENLSLSLVDGDLNKGTGTLFSDATGSLSLPSVAELDDHSNIPARATPVEAKSLLEEFIDLHKPFEAVAGVAPPFDILDDTDVTTLRANWEDIANDREDYEGNERLDVNRDGRINERDLKLVEFALKLDVNKDGSIDHKDANEIAEAVRKGNVNERYDVNGDKTVDASDRSIVSSAVKYVIGTPSPEWRLPEGLISEVAYGENSTYFVFTPGFAERDTTVAYKNTITLDIPGSGFYQKDNLDLKKLFEELPEDYPYFMIPLAPPDVSELKNAIDGTKSGFWEAAGSFGWNLGWLALGMVNADILQDGVKTGVEAVRFGKTIYDIIQTTKDAGELTTIAYMDLDAEKRTILDKFLQSFEPPQVTIRDPSIFFPHEENVIGDTPKFLIMIPRAVEFIPILMEQHIVSNDNKIPLAIKNAKPHTSISILPNDISDIFKTRITLSRSRDNTRQHNIIGQLTDPVGNLKEGLIDPFVSPTLIEFLTHESGLTSDEIEEIKESDRKEIGAMLDNFGEAVKDTRVGEKKLSELNTVSDDNSPDFYAPVPENTINIRVMWPLRNSRGAPNVKPMSLSDYPPFQQLPPEIQAYLLQYFEGTANPKPLNLEAREIPLETSLLPNYPNPFNPETWIPYQLATPADVTLTIYDIQGRVVRGLDLGHQRPGMYHSRSRAAYWDGKNAHGESVASGVYFYTLTAGDFSATRKLLIRK